MEICPKCKSSKGYYYKDTHSIPSCYSFERVMLGSHDRKITRRGEKARCLDCDRRLPDMDRENEPKEKEY